jgi:glutathione S-transferase
VLWFLEELGVPYEITTYDRDPKTLLAPESLQRVHPLGKSPVITDDGKTIAESGAILEYLVEKYGNGRFVPPKDTQAFMDYRYFMHYAEGSLAPFLVLKLVFKRIETGPIPFFAKPIARAISKKVNAQFIDPNLKRHVEFLNDRLSKHTWFAGDEFTAADVQMSFPAEAAVARAQGVADVSKLEDFVKRFKARPGFQKAIDRAGPYSLTD